MFLFLVGAATVAIYLYRDLQGSIRAGEMKTKKGSRMHLKQLTAEVMRLNKDLKAMQEAFDAQENTKR